MAEATAMTQHPEYVGGKPMIDLSAHLCRKGLGTRAPGYMVPLDLDEILGLKSSQSVK